MKMKKAFLILIMLCMLPWMSADAATSDYLILQDIGIYKLSKPEKFFPGEPPMGGPVTSDDAGVLSGASHFLDHADKTYTVMYLGGGSYPSPTVKVTRHAGVDSDTWLLHEVETSFRDSENLEVRPDEDARIRIINNNKIFFYSGGVVGYRWLRNNVVVDIEYSNLSGPKSEPIGVVHAYLAKFPSTITITDAELKASAHNVQWIKDEMERRLWLCDKWLMQLQLGKATQTDTLEELVKHMTVFLNYRQKYYGDKAADDIAALNTALRASDGTTIKNKLTAYKTWWSAYKGKRIRL